MNPFANTYERETRVLLLCTTLLMLLPNQHWSAWSPFVFLSRAKVSGTVQAYWEGWGTTLHSSRYVYTKFHHKTHINGQHIAKSLGPLARESHCIMHLVVQRGVLYYELLPRVVIMTAGIYCKQLRRLACNPLKMANKTAWCDVTPR